ncbi:MAG: tRNA (guanosine(37)-N1)-methyltransferase TrmD, partial [Eubacteriales bacterium]|nr:tRNA (guanosine(37)-N1)-methyltransferase TrmD [Eubacteriales bacterium]
MRIKVLTIFPEMLRAMLSESILGRAIQGGKLDVELIDIRPYAENKHKNTDDYPFGGGAGMVMLAQPIVSAMEANTGPDFRGRRIYMSPRGRTLTQQIVEELSREEELVLLCGHYEGVDQRALDLCIDEELSIGDYVLTGGELAALVVIDSVSRLLPGVLGSAESAQDESFTTGLLEYPQYTRPREFRGMAVPEVLLNGNHAHITKWRREQALETTLRYRPEMLESAPLDPADRAFLQELRKRMEKAKEEKSMASKVYFTSMRTVGNENITAKLVRLCREAGIEKIDFQNKFTAVKMHFGEQGNLAFLRADYARSVVDLIKSLGGKPFVTDCSTLY